MVIIGLIVVLTIIDLAIKFKIEQQDSTAFPREMKGSRGLIMLHKNHNPGFSFGVLKDKPELVRFIPFGVISALGGILCFLLPKKGYWLDKIAVAVTLGGAISNLYDRLTRHYVVDYFSIQWKGFKNVVFNLGDIFIFLGSGIMVLSELLQSVKEN